MAYHFVSSTSSLAQAEESSADCFAAMCQSAPSSWRNTLAGCSSSDSATASCPGFPSGMMSAPSTAVLGGAALTSSPEASPARTSAARGEALASKASGPAYGLSSPGSLARFDPASSSWKTPHSSLFEGLDAFSGTWPRWGSMRNGVCWGRITPAHLISASESGFWPTPKASPAGPDFAAISRPGVGGVSLATAVALWPTPLASDAKGSLGVHRGNGRTKRNLAREVKHFASPAARDWRSGKGRKDNGHTPQLPEQVGGQLNPDWVELLMGWPMGWTCLDPMNELEYQLWGDGFGTNPGNPEELPALRKVAGAEEIRGSAGRPIGLQPPQILFSGLRQQPETPEALGDTPLAGEEVPQGSMRSLRIQKGTPGSPCGPESRKQRPDQSSNAVQALPRFLAHYGPQAWQDGSWENAVPRVAQKVANRVDRLRALGNGQVPAVARLAWEVLK